MANQHDRFDELASIYALGALDGEELSEFEEHLKTGCAICQQTFKETEMILPLVIPYLLPAAQPSPGVKERLFKKIKAPKKMGKSPYRPTFWDRPQPVWFRLAGTVVLALLVLLFITNLFL